MMRIIYLYDDVKIREVCRNYSCASENNTYAIGLINSAEAAVVAVAAIKISLSSSSPSSTINSFQAIARQRGRKRGPFFGGAYFPQKWDLLPPF
jgi:hypothetical protein